MTITYKRIEPITFGGAGNGNTYRYEVREGDMVTIASSARDVASAYFWAGLPVPEELQGPYDGYGHVRV